MLRTFLRYISLQGHLEEHETIHDSIVKGIEFKGTNLWILVFAISMICIGLNINSPAVIIGAMLISPMMGPIVGMGYCIATYDFVLFRKALKNFSFAALAGLATSTLYFFISPVSTASSELLALTRPTIYDVLIAFLGGLAAIIAISSRNKGNIIAGAAIATALMPPLCTAGYGLATGHFEYLFGAVYLFVINAVFIGISSTLISRFLKFPIRSSVDDKQKKIVTRVIWVIIIVTFIPSVYLGYKLVKEERFKENAAQFTSEVNMVEGDYLLDKVINPSQRTIQLIYGGNSLTEEDKDAIRSRALNYGLDDAQITIEQGFSFDQIHNAATEADKTKAELNRLKILLDNSQNKIDSLSNQTMLGKQLLGEIKALYPSIETCTYSEGLEYGAKNNQSKKVFMVSFSSQNKLAASDKDKIEDWLKNRIKSDNVKTYFEE